MVSTASDSSTSDDPVFSIQIRDASLPQMDRLALSDALVVGVTQARSSRPKTPQETMMDQATVKLGATMMDQATMKVGATTMDQATMEGVTTMVDKAKAVNLRGKVRGAPLLWVFFGGCRGAAAAAFSPAISARTMGILSHSHMGFCHIHTWLC